MKLSEAMRLGIQQTGPCVGRYIEVNNDGTCNACPLGAALFGYDAVDIKVDRFYSEQPGVFLKLGSNSFNNALRDLMKQNGQREALDWNDALTIHQMTGCDPSLFCHDAPSAAIYLNDHHGTSREKIADVFEAIGL